MLNVCPLEKLTPVRVIVAAPSNVIQPFSVSIYCLKSSSFVPGMLCVLAGVDSLDDMSDSLGAPARFIPPGELLGGGFAMSESFRPPPPNLLALRSPRERVGMAGAEL